MKSCEENGLVPCRILSENLDRFLCCKGKTKDLALLELRASKSVS